VNSLRLATPGVNTAASKNSYYIIHTRASGSRGGGSLGEQFLGA